MWLRSFRGQVEVEAVKHSPSSDNSSSGAKDPESGDAPNHKETNYCASSEDEHPEGPFYVTN